VSKTPPMKPNARAELREMAAGERRPAQRIDGRARLVTPHDMHAAKLDLALRQLRPDPVWAEA
jgi:hypothetical protein